MPTIAIVGAGLIGRAWAGVFARGGWEVRVTDPSRDVLESVPRLIRESLDEQAALGLAQDPARAATTTAWAKCRSTCGRSPSASCSIASRRY